MNFCFALFYLVKRTAAFLLSQHFNSWLQVLQEALWAMCGNKRSRRESISFAFHWDQQMTRLCSKASVLKEQELPFNFRSSPGSPVLLIFDLLLQTHCGQRGGVAVACVSFWLSGYIFIPFLDKFLSLCIPGVTHVTGLHSVFAMILGNFQAHFNLNCYPYF